MLGGRLDPAGARATAALVREINELSWSQVAWLLDGREHSFVAKIGSRHRRVRIVAEWDMDDWASDTYVWVRVPLVVAGRTLGRCRHRGLAGHPGERLPQASPVAEPVDLAALLAGSAGR